MAYLKKTMVPKSWPVKRRGTGYVSRMNPGPHSYNFGMPLKLVIRDILNFAKTSKETSKLLCNNEVLVDGVRRKDGRFPVGIMDVIEIKKTNEYFRAVFDKGKISLAAIDKKESEFKLCKIIGKSKVKGKMQLNLYDGKNILIDGGEYKTGDTLAISLPKQEIKEHIKLGRGSFIYLIGGKHLGETGRVEDIIGKKITYKKENGDMVETLKEYVFVVGKDKPIVSLSKKA